MASAQSENLTDSAALTSQKADNKIKMYDFSSCVHQPFLLLRLSIGNLRCKQQFENFSVTSLGNSQFKPDLCGLFAIRKSRWAVKRRLDQDTDSSQFSLKLRLGLSFFLRILIPLLAQDRQWYVACSAGCTADAIRLCTCWPSRNWVTNYLIPRPRYYSS